MTRKLLDLVQPPKLSHNDAINDININTKIISIGFVLSHFQNTTDCPGRAVVASEVVDYMQQDVLNTTYAVTNSEVKFASTSTT